MYKQVFDYNGNPYLVKTEEDGTLSEKDLKRQNLYQYTDIMPPSHLYPPRKFDGEQWHGASSDDHNKPPIILPDEMQKTIANLQVQLVKSQSEIKNLKKRFEDLKSDKEEGVE